MARLIVSREADADVASILDDLARRAGLAVADRYDAAFETLFERLTVHPQSGVRRPQLGPDLRIALVAPFIVFYDFIELEDLVRILRVAHDRRSLSATFIRGAPRPQ